MSDHHRRYSKFENENQTDRDNRRRRPDRRYDDHEHPPKVRMRNFIFFFEC